VLVFFRLELLVMSTHSLPAHGVPNRPAGGNTRTRGWVVRAIIFVLRGIPTAIVLVALAAVAWFGHRHEWKVPKYSELVQLATSKPAEKEFCEEHSVLEGYCIECNTKLAPKPHDYGWCQEHGISQCIYHHPELAQVANPLPLSPEDVARIERALAVRPRQMNNSRCTLHQRRIQFSSPAAVDKSGIEVAVVETRPLVESISANGQIAYRSGSVAHLASRLPGSIVLIEKQIGQPVKKGDLLALVDSVEVGKAKETLVQAIVRARADRLAYEKLLELPEGGIAANRIRTSKATMDVSTSGVLAAEQVLANLGLAMTAGDLGDGSPDQLMAKLRLLGISEYTFESLNVAPSSNLFPVRASQDGILVDVHAVPGEVVDSQTRLFVIADTRRMTAILQVPAEESSYLQLGQKIEFHLEGARKKKAGTINWISPEMDPQTRTVQIRSDLDNTDATLRANAFGTGQIVLREEPKGIVVPADALQWEGDCNVVFVRTKDYFKKDAPKFFEVRKVVPGVKTSQGIELIAGVVPGEVVAAKGSDVLIGELLKNSLGSGCCADHAH
jgi:cobalt-zinc-cadmium efflux system membrane fusion protein